MVKILFRLELLQVSNRLVSTIIPSALRKTDRTRDGPISMAVWKTSMLNGVWRYKYSAVSLQAHRLFRMWIVNMGVCAPSFFLLCCSSYFNPFRLRSGLGVGGRRILCAEGKEDREEGARGVAEKLLFQDMFFSLKRRRENVRDSCVLWHW